MNLIAIVLFAAFVNHTESPDKIAITCMHSLRECGRVSLAKPTDGAPPPAEVDVILTAQTARALGLSDESGDGYVSVPMTRAAAIDLYEAQDDLRTDMSAEILIAAAYALGRRGDGELP